MDLDDGIGAGRTFAHVDRVDNLNPWTFLVRIDAALGHMLSLAPRRLDVGRSPVCPFVSADEAATARCGDEGANRSLAAAKPRAPTAPVAPRRIAETAAYLVMTFISRE
ncbi:hypothetical protein AUC69_08365 [Methyloceanibacter superfactus]|uniref:Uncharacterized protein n=1 Tax=Methyloceanibacter superfactus TaxID=1774969 RepID=A0A1E3W1H0_9HYPH|nr:hypothetical protein AUC69_08365 [Methyloceanibacter superfactus]